MTGGDILEPSLGTGNFIGLLPESWRGQSKITGIELDPTTAAIAGYLFPKATVINQGYQDVMIPAGHFDVVVGNPPFGNQSVFDPHHRDLSEFSIHNYFLAKSLDKVREGGVVAVVVSNYFLDANQSATREWITDRAHLLGAVRLPNTAFKQNAMTEVTTDIVFLQKAQRSDSPDRSWVTVGAIDDLHSDKTIPLNHYYVQNPHMILGRMALTGTMYRDDTPTCVALPEIDLPQRLATVLATLPENVYTPRIAPAESDQPILPAIAVPDSIKVGAFFLADGRIARRVSDMLGEQHAEWFEPKNAKAGERIEGMIGIRTTLRGLMDAERSGDTPESDVSALRQTLNQRYDRFVQQNGYISALANKQAMGADPDYPLLHSLERNYDKGISKEIAERDGIAARAPRVDKAAIFSKRVIKSHREITSAGNAKDAMLVVGFP